MHNGCSGHHESGKEIVDKIRMMGFNTTPVTYPINIHCSNCDADFDMTYMESKCPDCNMVYGVTPCSAHDPNAVKPAGIDY